MASELPTRWESSPSHQAQWLPVSRAGFVRLYSIFSDHLRAALGRAGRLFGQPWGTSRLLGFQELLQPGLEEGKLEEWVHLVWKVTGLMGKEGLFLRAQGH